MCCRTGTESQQCLNTGNGEISMNFNIKQMHQILDGRTLVVKQLCRKGSEGSQ